MSSHAEHPRRQQIAIIGGGITGLAAAHRVLELYPTCRVTLFEASSRLGGILHSEQQDEFLLEFGADNFITNVPWGIDLCRRIGFADELLETSPASAVLWSFEGGSYIPCPRASC